MQENGTNSNMRNGQVQTNNPGSILDAIHEKASNIEQATNSQTIKNGLDNMIKVAAKRERKLRESTLTIKHSETLDHGTIIDIIETKWVIGEKQLPITFWQDKENTYAQLHDKETKDKLLNKFKDPSWIANENDKLLKAAINNINGQIHYTRKQVKIEISNVRGNVKADLIKTTLDELMKDTAIIVGFKEGKPHNITKARSIYFRVDAEGVRKLLGTMDGAIPYLNRATSTRIKLFTKINVKPWQCKDCQTFGQHQCSGKTCNQCGIKGHETKECKSKTKHCNNCKRKGHRTKDVHCPIYMAEILKEIKKADLPLEYLENKELRQQLINSLQYR